MSSGNIAITPKKAGGIMPAQSGGNMGLVQEVASALTNLGYSPSDAARVSAKLMQSADENATVESLIPLALRELSS